LLGAFAQSLADVFGARFGPQLQDFVRALTAKLGAAWIATAGDVEGAVAAMTDMQERRRAAGRETEHSTPWC
jgi:hypothetical protein